MSLVDQPAILSVGTALAPFSFSQARAADWLALSLRENPAKARWIRAICRGSGIETRHFCIPDGLETPDLSKFAPTRNLAEAATTAERMELFRRYAPPLAEDAGRDALARLSARTNQSLAHVTETISHLILVTCTGFFAPGLDIAIRDRLKLPQEVERIQIGFMGCSAMFNAWRTAASIVSGSPQARVLIVCVEVCSIHLQPSLDRQHLISAALFGDAAGACIIGAPTDWLPGCVSLMKFSSRVLPDTSGEMVWEIGDHGFSLDLSPRIPEILSVAAPPALRKLFPEGLRPEVWAIHPGGRAILDQLSETFGLGADKIAASRAALRRVGNVSSATMAFVLRELLTELEASPLGLRELDGIAVGFGPGLVMEMAHLRFQAVRGPSAPVEDSRSTTRW